MSPERQESFNRLAWTMAGLAAALGPHLLRMQAWVSAFVIGTCAWRLLAERRGWRMPPAFLRALVAAGATVGVAVGYSTITGLDGGTALLALMSALKLLETRTARDHAILIFIGWFLCLAAFLYVQDIVTAAWVLPTVWLLAAALLRVSRRGTGGPASRPFRTTGAMHSAQRRPSTRLRSIETVDDRPSNDTSDRMRITQQKTHKTCKKTALPNRRPSTVIPTVSIQSRPVYKGDIGLLIGFYNPLCPQRSMMHRKPRNHLYLWRPTFRPPCLQQSVSFCVQAG